MLAKIVNEKTKQCIVFLGTNSEGLSGFSDMEIEVADGSYFVKGYAPKAPEPTKEQQSTNRETAYQQYVDPITCHISRLMDEEQTEDITAEITALKSERAAKVAEIKAQYPYPEVTSE